MTTAAEISAAAANLLNPWEMLTAGIVPRLLIGDTGWGQVRWGYETTNGKTPRSAWVPWAKLPGTWAPITVNRMTAWVEVDPGDPAAGRPCEALIPHGGFSSPVCMRRALPGDDLCKMHRGHVVRNEQRAAARAAKVAAAVAERERLRQIAADLSELWALAADAVGVEPERAGRVNPMSSATVVVDSEALRAILTAVIDR